MTDYGRTSRFERRDPPMAPFLVVVPFTRKKSLVLIKTFDEHFPTREKNDLNATDPPMPPLTASEDRMVKTLAGRTSLELEALMAGELFFLAGLLGVEMFNLFKNNPAAGRRIEFRAGSKLTKAVEATVSFESVHQKVHEEFNDLIKQQFFVRFVDPSRLEATKIGKGKFGRTLLFNPNGIKTSVDIAIPPTNIPLQAVIGGSFQGGQVALKEFSADSAKKTYKATLEYTLIDHFGVDNSDVLPPPPHGSPGQIAFWLLQHRHHPGHYPYLTTVIIEREVSGGPFIVG